jgi:hypothetical protein
MEIKQNSHYFIQELYALHSSMRNVVLLKISNNTYTLTVNVFQTDTNVTRMKDIPVERKGRLEHACLARVRTISCLREEDTF